MTTKLNIENMTCASCVRIIRSELDSIDGVEVQNINIANKSVDIEYKNNTDLIEAKEKLELAGYKVID